MRKGREIKEASGYNNSQISRTVTESKPFIPNLRDFRSWEESPANVLMEGPFLETSFEGGLFISLLYLSRVLNSLNKEKKI